MKKIHFMLMLILCCILLPGCAGRESEEEAWRGVGQGMDDLTVITERTEYYDIVLESEEIFHLGLGANDTFLGMQFYQEEPVQLWAKGSNIYLYRMDKSGGIILQDVPAAYIRFDKFSSWNWYISREGDFYCWHDANYFISHPDEIDDSRKVEAVFAKISASGDVLYETAFAPGVSIEDFRQLSDGRCFLILKDETAQVKTLEELDPDKGNFRRADKVQLIHSAVERQYLGEADGLPAIFNHTVNTDKEINKINPTDGTKSCVLSFTGTSCAVEHGVSLLQDFRVLEDGSVELLWLDSIRNTEGTLEKLWMEKVEKTPIVVRGNFESDIWLIGLAARFNQQSGDYHVILEDCGRGNDVEEFARLTSIQLAAGKGPDILQAGFMQDYISGMAEKGVMEDLSSYMEKSGIREEDYFPFVFDIWRDGGHIYGVNPSMSISGFQMDESVLGGRETPDIETLVDALISWEGNTVFLSGKNSRELLKIFLQGTETLWGMVDWEKGSCDFSGELFAKLLESADQYGDDGRKGSQSGIAEWREFYSIFEFDSTAEQESAGKVTCGVLFDDGCHAAVYPWQTMIVNSNSANKEGAWEFLCFLLGEEAQSFKTNIPVNMSSFELWLEQQRAQVADGKEKYMIVTAGGEQTVVTYTEEDLTEEKLAEYRKTLAEAEACPIKTAPIIDIILEEAEDYFNGSKSAAQVSRLVTNRVQLYLDEVR